MTTIAAACEDFWLVNCSFFRAACEDFWLVTSSFFRLPKNRSIPAGGRAGAATGDRNDDSENGNRE